MIGWSGIAALALVDLLIWGIAYSGDHRSVGDRRLWRYASIRYVGGRGRRSVWKRVGHPVIRAVAARLSRVASGSRRRHESDRLARAGLDWDLALFDGVKWCGGVVGIAFAIFTGLLVALPGGVAAWSAVAGGLGYLAPLLWVRRRASAREREFRRALPDALDVLVICLRAGLSFHAAVAEYTQTATGVAGEAFRRYLADLALGQTPEAGLAEMARRFPSDDLAVVSAALIQGIRLGSPLADVIEEQATHFRVLALRRAEENARTLTTRLVLPLVAFIFPLVFIIGLGPVMLRLLGPGGLLR